MKRQSLRRARESASTWLPAALVAAATVCALPALAQSTTVPTTAFENAKFQYSVSMPSGCRHDQGPGTLDAVCSTKFDAQESATASAASSLVLEVSAQTVAEDVAKAPAELAQSFTEAQFKAELPEAVCGEADRDRVKIDNVRQVLEDDRVVYRADVVCPEIRFLWLEERQASVEYVITPSSRYRLMARAPKEEFEQRKAAIDAFLASFHLTSAK
jgi:hypothetical protein